ncbi:MarR family winged helix-turn-helix transcriptional regulator, partial [Muricomes intestini]
VARKLGITAGSLTTSVNSLVNKKYLVRERSESDRRVVYVRLTEKGRKAFFHHKDYHMQMTDAVVKSLDADEIPVLLKTLNSLSEFFRGYETKK